MSRISEAKILIFVIISQRLTCDESDETGESKSRANTTVFNHLKPSNMLHSSIESIVTTIVTLPQISPS